MIEDPSFTYFHFQSLSRILDPQHHFPYSCNHGVFGVSFADVAMLLLQSNLLDRPALSTAYPRGMAW